MTPEGAVLKAVCDLLAAERIPFWRMNTGAVKTEKRFFRFGEKGMADVLAAPMVSAEMYRDSFDNCEVQYPAFLWIECKSEKGNLSPEQESFGLRVKENGMEYIVARSSDDVLQWLRDNGVKR